MAARLTMASSGPDQIPNIGHFRVDFDPDDPRGPVDQIDLSAANGRPGSAGRPARQWRGPDPGKPAPVPRSQQRLGGRDHPTDHTIDSARWRSWILVASAGPKAPAGIASFSNQAPSASSCSFLMRVELETGKCQAALKPPDSRET